MEGSERKKEQIKRAQEKYVKVSTRSYLLRFHKDKDGDVIEMLDRIKNRQNYVKDLIKADIRENGGNIKEIAEARKSDSRRIVKVSFDKRSRYWKAVCAAANIKIKSDSYDILLTKINNKIEKPYLIVTEDISIK